MFWGGLFTIATGLIITAGAITILASQLVPSLEADVAEGIRRHCPPNSPRLYRDLCQLAANNLAHPDDRGPIGFVRDAVEWVSSKTQRLRDKMDSGLRALSDLVQDEDSREPPLVEDAPIRRIPDDTPSETVRGTVTDGTTTVSVVGTVTSGGDFFVMGDGVKIDGSIGDGSSVAGDFIWGNDNGAIGGNLIGHPALIRPLPDWQEPVGGSTTMDLSHYFEDPYDGPLNYKAASPDPNIVSVDVAGTMLTITGVGQGTTYATVSAWNTD